MEIPKKIKVGAHEITIEIVDPIRSGNAGVYNIYSNLIMLENDADKPESNLSECFLHEIIECIKAKNNLEIDHTHLTVLSESLFQVLRDNRLEFHKSD